MTRPPNIPKRKLPNPVKSVPQKNEVAPLISQGLALHQQGKFNEAQALYEQVLETQANYFDALQLSGALLVQTKQFTKAVYFLTRALQVNPNHAASYSNLGIALQELKLFKEALESYEEAVRIKPDYADAYYNRGNILQKLEQFEEAIASYDKAISINPNYADAQSNRGIALKALGSLDEALASYDKAIRIKPDFVDAYSNRGIVLQKLKRLDEALASYDKAISINTYSADVHSNRGIVLQELKRLDEALASYDKAISINSNYADAYSNRGIVLQELKRLDEALASYDKAISINSNYADAYSNRGNTLKELGRLDEALASYDKALSLKLDIDWVSGDLLHTKMKICSWSGLVDSLDIVSKKVIVNEKVINPFVLLTLSNDNFLHKKSSDIYIQSKYPLNPSLGPILKHPQSPKIRVGYFSADFHNHATGYLMAELFEIHDKSQFELVGLSFGPIANDEMRQRLEKPFDQFIEVGRKSDVEVARLSRDLNIDIAVDLKGFTKDSRTGIFSYRAAPIQVNYLGYPGTMGADYIDYIIADKTLIPLDVQSSYSEKVVYLPNSYQVNDRKRAISEKQFTRHELGLPEDGFVFCCFNNNFKILPATFTSWMRILKAVEGSVLWLLQDNPWAVENLKKEALKQGVDAQRLVFAERMPLQEHLARHRQADLFLDTLPYNAHTTTSDALWSGLPVLTLIGQSFASRVAASLLNAIGLPELITNTQEQYETLAVGLAQNPQKLAEIKLKLTNNRLIAPLFDTPLFTKNLEDAYIKMYERYQSDLEPDHIVIA